jgi:hypothetical protein
MARLINGVLFLLFNVNLVSINHFQRRVVAAPSNTSLLDTNISSSSSLLRSILRLSEHYLLLNSTCSTAEEASAFFQGLKALNTIAANIQNSLR